MTHPTPAATGAQFRGLFQSLVLNPGLLFGGVLPEPALLRSGKGVRNR